MRFHLFTAAFPSFFARDVTQNIPTRTFPPYIANTATLSKHCRRAGYRLVAEDVCTASQREYHTTNAKPMPIISGETDASEPLRSFRKRLWDPGQQRTQCREGYAAQELCPNGRPARPGVQPRPNKVDQNPCRVQESGAERHRRTPERPYHRRRRSHWVRLPFLSQGLEQGYSGYGTAGVGAGQAKARFQPLSSGADADNNDGSAPAPPSDLRQKAEIYSSAAPPQGSRPCDAPNLYATELRKTGPGRVPHRLSYFAGTGAVCGAPSTVMYATTGSAPTQTISVWRRIENEIVSRRATTPHTIRTFA